MPYKDAERQREYMRAWRETHPERVRAYQRSAVLQSAVSRGRFPSLSSVERHLFSEEELLRVVACVVQRCAG